MAIAPARSVGRECDAGMSLYKDIAMFFQVYGRMFERSFADKSPKVKGRKRKTGLQKMQPGKVKRLA
ncbi:hypothetical protein [Thalassospira sp. GB04J01]|uniref:hypothetical protein n=1 Tax=Thalassospira TaxID=168934 RepID=UPI000C0C8977|nr:hypothetical protein [Thalassospira sp. GB04J01]MBV16912.1 hypothetical protein [Thalassospira sp.]|tara:strand:+ start:44654 stop:44854 length:201 start_codon:yes stop_codon:yes gene_type:complete